MPITKYPDPKLSTIGNKQVRVIEEELSISGYTEIELLQQLVHRMDTLLLKASEAWNLHDFEEEEV